MKRLLARERGLYGARFEELLGAKVRPLATSALLLARLGEPVAFRVEPDPRIFAKGSTLYFFSEGASLNPYGNEAVYELEASSGGERMETASAVPRGNAVSFYRALVKQEQNRYYQAGLLDAPDLWFWDLLLAPSVKNYPFDVAELAAVSEPARLSLWLQGVSDTEASPDHHVRVGVNGAWVADRTFEGKKSLALEIDLPAGALREGENAVALENVGDTGASYSMVMLDRFEVSYPRRLVAESGRLRGSFSSTGAAAVEGLSAEALVVDVTDPRPIWLEGASRTGAGLAFFVEAGREYLAVSREAVLKPERRNPSAAILRNSSNRVDYLVVGPRAMLEVAEPLLQLRRSQGLRTRAVAIEQVYEEFGQGETRPEAVRELLSYAYHHWKKPALRYVVLLGDASYDFKDYLRTGVQNQVPPYLIKTSYLWTASDAVYASVNGEDLLPDIAIGRMPAATVAEARVMIEKVVAYESASHAASRAVMVADNPDAAGDFEAHAETIASGVLASRDPERIYLSRLSAGATRQAIVDAFDAGAGLVSYVGHGGIHLWAQENIFSTSDVSLLSAQAEQPLVLTLNCLNGYFHFPYFNSLAEELIKAEGKGAIAAFSPSGLSLDEPAHVFHQALVSELVSGKHARLGDAWLTAQAAYARSGAFPELLSIYHLLGDPALSLR